MVDRVGEPVTATAVRFGRCDPAHEIRTWFVHVDHAVALACDLVALGYPVVGLRPLGPDAVTAVCDDCGRPVTFVRAPVEGTT